jgi:glycosyltransferase involved in cell wall biosynthesis
MLKVLLVTNNLFPATGGASEALIKTNKWLNESNIRTRVLAINDGDSRFFIFNFKKIILEFDVVHIFSGWNFYVPYLINLSKKLKKKVFFSPLGQLDEWSLNQKSFKKSFALNLYLKRSLKKCNAIIVASEKEKNDVSKFSFDKVLVLGHGVDLPNNEILKNKIFNKVKKKLIFISRLHYKKGIQNLLEAWNQAKLNNWELKIYGPESDNLRYIDKANLSNNAEIKDPVYGKDKIDIILKSDLLILPSLSENFGLIIAESLSLGLPVATTVNTPWIDIVEDKVNCGWIIDESVDGIYDFLKKIEKITTDELKLKSNNGIFYIKKKFNNKDIIKRYIDAYEKL